MFMQQQLPDGYTLQGGKYRIISAIGQGGFGITYRAEMHTQVSGAFGPTMMRVPVAIKEFFFLDHCTRDPLTQAVVTNEAIAGAQMFQRFKSKLIKEATILSRLRHENIVSVSDIFEENGTAYMVMDYVQGRSLDAVVREAGGRLPQARALRYASQLCYAADAIHREHVLHLDIKPGNVLIDVDDRVRVIDFGISKQYDSGHQETSTTPVGISKGYAPVEQYSDVSRFTPQTDIYAIGATIYYMLTGRTPVESILRVASESLPPIEQVNPSVSPHVAAAVRCAMSIRPDDRQSSAAELSAQLNSQAVPPEEIPPVEQPGGDTVVNGNPQPPSGQKPENVSGQNNRVLPPEQPSARQKRPGGLSITMLCIGLTAGLLALLISVALCESMSDSDIEAGLSFGIIGCVVTSWTSMLSCKAFKGSARVVPVLLALAASATFIFRYSGGIDYGFITRYTDFFYPAQVAGVLATLLAFFSFKAERIFSGIAMAMLVLGAVLWLAPGF